MLLENRTAVVYGAAGAMGGAVTRAFAREGARLFLAGRTLATLDVLADELVDDRAAAQIYDRPDHRSRAIGGEEDRSVSDLAQERQAAVERIARRRGRHTTLGVKFQPDRDVFCHSHISESHDDAAMVASGSDCFRG